MNTPEIFKTLADAALHYSTINTVMFAGLAVVFSFLLLLFFANGCAMYIHDKYDLDKALWYKKCTTAGTTLLFAWNITYITSALVFSIGILQVGLTYVFALVCAGCIGICTSLLYNLVWYVFIAPCLYVCRKNRK